MCYRAWLLKILYILLGLCRLDEQCSSKLQNSGVDWMDGVTVRLWTMWNSEGFQDTDTESAGCGVFFSDQRGRVSVRMIYFKWSFKSPPSAILPGLLEDTCWNSIQFRAASGCGSDHCDDDILLCLEELWRKSWYPMFERSPLGCLRPLPGHHFLRRGHPAQSGLCVYTCLTPHAQ